jgi:hypothetical protein
VSPQVRQVDAERFEVVLPDRVVVVELTRASRDALGLRGFGPAAVVGAAVELLLEQGDTLVGDAGVPDVIARLAQYPGLLEELRARIG